MDTYNKMVYQIFTFVAIVITPFLFPNIFWKNSDKKIKLVYYNIVRESDNPYMDEPTSISFYDDTRGSWVINNIYEKFVHSFDDIKSNSQVNPILHIKNPELLSWKQSYSNNSYIKQKKSYLDLKDKNNTNSYLSYLISKQDFTKNSSLNIYSHFSESSDTTLKNNQLN
jgi:hypothetical protein